MGGAVMRSALRLVLTRRTRIKPQGSVIYSELPHGGEEKDLEYRDFGETIFYLIIAVYGVRHFVSREKPVQFGLDSRCRFALSSSHLEASSYHLLTISPCHLIQ